MTHFDLMHFLKIRYIHIQSILPLSITFIFFNFGLSMISPVFAIYVNDITNSLFLTGVFFSILGIVRLLTDIPFGIFCDRYGPKRLFIASILFYIPVIFSYAFVGNAFQLFIVRFLHVILVSLFWVSAWTIARRVSVNEYKSEEMGFFLVMRNLSALIAPIIGSVLVTIYFIEISFLLFPLFGFIAFLWAFFKIKPSKMRYGHDLSSFKKDFKDFMSLGGKGVRLGILMVFLFGINSISHNFLPIYFENVGLSFLNIGIVFSFAITLPLLLVSVPAGVFVDKHGSNKLYVAGLSLIAVGLFFVANSSDLFSIILSSLIIFSGIAMVNILVNTEVIMIAKAEELGGFTGITESFKDIGFVIGPLLGGFLSQLIGIPQTFIICSALTMVFLVLFLRHSLIERVKPRISEVVRRQG